MFGNEPQSEIMFRKFDAPLWAKDTDIHSPSDAELTKSPTLTGAVNQSPTGKQIPNHAGNRAALAGLPTRDWRGQF